MNNKLQKLTDWFRANSLSLNISTKYKRWSYVMGGLLIDLTSVVIALLLILNKFDPNRLTTDWDISQNMNIYDSSDYLLTVKKLNYLWPRHEVKNILRLKLKTACTTTMSLKLTDITQWNVGAVVLVQFMPIKQPKRYWRTDRRK